MRHCNKIHIFLCLFFLFTITDRNEAIIVEFKKYLFSPFHGVPRPKKNIVCFRFPSNPIKTYATR